MRLRAKHLGMLLLLGLGIAAYAGKDELSFRHGRHGLEAVRISDAEFTVTDRFDDGPYLRRNETGIEASWICAGEVIREQFGPAPVTIPVRCGYEYPIQVRPPVLLDGEQPIPPLHKLVAVSDPHGQYDTLKTLLLRHGVIDADGNWALADGQLMLTGDVFDRGHQVTEIFWLLYALERQAVAAGGRLHFLLGNHEYMVLRDDLRYVNGKYLRTAALLGSSYVSLFAADTVLGQWLRSRDTVRQLDDMLFLHAGISPAFLAQKLTVSELNHRFRQSIGMSKDAVAAEPSLSALHATDGPIWYRGYFLDDTMSQQHIDQLTAQLGVDHIVVGHTSMPTVLPLFEQKVIGIDSSIKKGQRGELLIMENGQLSRGTFTGERIAL